MVAELLIALSTLSSLASAIEAHLIAKDEPTLMDWAEDFQDGVIEAMSITKRIPHQLRQRANHVEFSDGGNGVGILYLCVRVLMVLSLKVYDLNSITRVHNAPGGSSGMFAEQSIGAMNVYLSPTESMQGNGNHHAFANLAPDDLVTMSDDALNALSQEEADAKLRGLIQENRQIQAEMLQLAMKVGSRARRLPLQ